VKGHCRPSLADTDGSISLDSFPSFCQVNPCTYSLRKNFVFCLPVMTVDTQITMAVIKKTLRCSFLRMIDSLSKWGQISCVCIQPTSRVSFVFVQAIHRLNSASDEKMSFMFVQSDTMTEHFEPRVKTM